jgi:Zn-dependent protease
MLKNVRVGSIAGIPILINPSWLVPAGLVIWFLSARVYPDVYQGGNAALYIVMAVASALLFFVSLVFHELAHSVVARRYGIPVRSITLFLLGGVAQIARDPRTARAEFLIAVAGPLSSFAIGSALIGLWVVLSGGSGPLSIVIVWLGGMNLVVGVFNMLPIFPMDGGRVFRSMLWGLTGNAGRATSVAAWSGRGIAWAMMAAAGALILGVDLVVLHGTTDGLWFLMIGYFIESSARQSLFQNRLVGELSLFRARDIMVSEPPIVDAGASIAALARGVLELNPRICYFVDDHGRLAGVVSAHEMRAVPEPEWESTTAGQAMTPREAIHATGPDTLASDMLVEMESEDLQHMAVVSDDTVVGIVGRERIIGILRQSGLLGGATA